MANARSTIEKAPGALPVLGHVVAVFRDPLGFLTSWSPADGLGRVRIGPWTAVVVYDPVLTRRVLTDDRTFDKGGPVFDRAREVAGGGLATCPHHQHRRQRRLVQPSFHPARIRGYAELMTDQIGAATSAWRDGQIVDVRAEMMAITTRVAITTMFSAHRSRAAIDEACQDVCTVMAGIMRRTILPRPFAALPTPGNQRFRRARHRLRTFINTMIEQHRSSGQQGDLMAVLLEEGTAQPEGRRDAAPGPALSDAEIADQIMTFLMAGTDTTANTLAWALHLLAQHPQIEARLHREVDGALAGANATFEQLTELHLTERIVNESLRLYPPGWLLTRMTTTQTSLAGHRLAAGTVVVYSPYLLHRRSSTFSHPDRFDPDRWTGDNLARSPQGAFVPFGGGARKCIGESFAMVEAVLALATIAARWRFTATRDATVRPALGLALSPNGLHMRITARP